MMQGCGTIHEPTVATEVVPMPPRFPPVEPIIPVEPIESAVVPVPAVPQVKTWDPGETTVYKVRKGETLSQIAHRYDVAMADVVALNNIKNPNMIHVGQRLVLPGSGDVVESSAPTHSRPASVKVPAGGSEYVVQSGDCLSVIAKRFGVSTKSLRNVNKLKSDVIYVGQKLAIPAGGTKPIEKPVEPVASATNSDTAIDVLPPAIDETPDLGGVPDVPTTGIDPDVDLSPDLESVVPTIGDSGMGGGRIHKVVAGQSLLAIASEWNVSIDALREANPWLNEKEPQAGDELVIPPPEL
jgi:LysM repeat protein